ncbi:MAG: AraC family ligand binding domain-containing protein [Bacteroidales bacterium]|nr:AraC family ligand binding domain-containing protein [Bacteroidales bacterium]
MNPFHNHIPVYSLNSFRTSDDRSKLFQVEVFDANRHFQVSYPHRHDFYEMLYLKNGSGIHIIDSNEYRISPPCIFFLSPDRHINSIYRKILKAIFFFLHQNFIYSTKKKKITY